MGSFAGGPTAFLANFRDADGLNLFYAAVGGFIFNIANVLLIAGIEIVGLAVAFPLSIGIALAEGASSPTRCSRGQSHAARHRRADEPGRGHSRRQSIRRAAHGRGVVSRKGVIVCVISGLLMGTWAPFVTLAMTRGEHTLTPYTTTVFLTLGAFLCCFVFNIILMRKPIIGTPVAGRDYFRTSGKYHALGLLGGAIWGTGMAFNLVAGSAVGVSISYAIGQASPMVACLWGVFVWQGVSRRQHKG